MTMPIIITTAVKIVVAFIDGDATLTGLNYYF
jgi:hypothetical protein